jgi:hypothetical protein
MSPVTSAALEPRGRVATSLVEWQAQCTRGLLRKADTTPHAASDESD